MRVGNFKLVPLHRFMIWMRAETDTERETERDAGCWVGLRTQGSIRALPELDGLPVSR